jgi:membrane protease YdiL (CAAX protease family)
MALALERPEMARQFVEQAAAANLPGLELLRAEIFEKLGDTAAARNIYEAQTQEWNREATLVRLFEIDLASGDPALATRSYRTLRELGWSADPIGYHRLSLTLKHPGSPWAMQDLLGIFGLVVVLALFGGGLPALWILPVHYIGLLRRSRGAASVNTRWTLREAWWAWAIVLAGSLIALIAFSYAEVSSWLANTPVEPTTLELARTTFWSLLATVAAALFAMHWHDWRASLSRSWWGDRSTVRSVCVGMLWIFLAGWCNRVLVKLFDLVTEDPTAAATSTHLALKAMGAAYGSFTLFVMAVIVTPVAEEIVFRGVTFDALRQQLSTKWANIVQAALFALIHQELTALLPLFVMGMVTGSMRLRTGTLAAGILLHAANNAWVYALRM